MARNRTRRVDESAEGAGPHWRAGVAGGLAGGVLMFAFLMVVAVGRGLEAPTFARLVAATVLGSGAATGSAAVALGLAIHLATSCALGAVYAGVASRNVPLAIDVLVGLAYGTAAYLFMRVAVLPWANPILLDTLDRGWFFAAHLLYGVTLALVAQLRRDRHGKLERPEYRPTLPGPWSPR